ncbi:MAG: phosphoribosyltransferase [Thermoplasmata archaeon]
MLALKDGKLIGNPPQSMPDRVVEHLRRNPSLWTAASTTGDGSVVLVPIPKSSIHRAGSLWVPDTIAVAMVKAGFGARVARLLDRTVAIPKAARSSPANRPTARTHYESLAVQTDLTPASGYLLVDDVVTTGSAMVGSANRLCEVYPNVPIKGFAAMRTTSLETQFRQIVDPAKNGEITLHDDRWCQRTP